MIHSIVSEDDQQHVFNRVFWHIVPLILLLYGVAFLDRNNISYAHDSMSLSLGFTNSQYGVGAGIFFIGYIIVGLVSNAVIFRYGVRICLSVITVLWGFVVCAIASISHIGEYYFFRFILGIVEASFFPAILFYLTCWFPSKDRTKVLGGLIIAQPLANAIGAPISVWIINHPLFGLTGWQSMFICEGAVAVIVGIIAYIFLRNRPAEVTWLSHREKIHLIRMIGEIPQNKIRFSDFTAQLRNATGIIYGFINLGLAFSVYGLSFWMPTFIKTIADEKIISGWLIMLPYALSIPCVYLWSMVADKHGRRSQCAAIAMLIGAGGFMAAALTYMQSSVCAMVGLIMATIGAFSAIAPLFALPSSAFSSSLASAAVLSVVSTFGSIGGFISSVLIGVIGMHYGFGVVMLFLASLLILSGLSVYVYGHNKSESFGY